MMVKTARIALGLLLLSLSLVHAQENNPTPTPAPRPPAERVLADGNVSAQLFFRELAQGQAGLLRVPDDIALVEGWARFMDRDYTLTRIPGDGWYALVIAAIDAGPREYPLTVFLRLEDGLELVLSDTVRVVASGYARQEFRVPNDRVHLINPQVERQEFARLDAIFADITPERLWTNGGFQAPMDVTTVTSAFGGYRILNQSIQTRHTGWDFRAPVGTPVMAMGAGRVSFAGRLDIRGNHVIIDHGWGIYSGYSHLSQVNVQPGQRVTRGQIIGASGNTGRSSGPHLHWEVAVQGEWVDSLAFLDLWLP